MWHAIRAAGTPSSACSSTTATSLTVRDHGTGLGADWTRGSGILGMRERAGLIGAALEISNHSRGGTEVHLRVPVEVAV